MSQNPEYQRAVAEDARARRRRIASAEAWTKLDVAGQERITARRIADTHIRLECAENVVRWETAFLDGLVGDRDYCLI